MQNLSIYIVLCLSLFSLVVIISACSGIPVPSTSATKKPAAVAHENTTTRGISVHLPHQPPMQSIPTHVSKPTPRVPTPPPHMALQPPAPPQSTVTGGAQTMQEQQLVQQLFARINQDRANAGLPPLVWNTILAGTAYQHSTRMVEGCGIAHQCAGEPAPCQRIANAGLNDPACGENIGNAAATPTLWAGVQQIDVGMLNEPAPAFHRRNILSTTHHAVGISIRISATNQTWITEDFSNL